MTEESASASISRRQLLRLGGVGIAGLAGCPGDDGPGPETDVSPTNTSTTSTPGTATTPTSRIPPDYAERFDSIVDITAAGADPSGSRAVDDVIQSVAADDTLIVFPDGQYRIDELSMPAPDNFGFFAPSEADSSIVPTEGKPNIEWLLLSDATDFLYDGIDFDFRETGPVGGTVFSGPGDIVFRNLRVRGDYETLEQQLMRIDVTNTDGEALVDNLVASAADKSDVNTTGLYVGRTHAGEITFRNCQLEGFSDNAIYASPPGGDGDRFDAKDGAVHVRGGLFRNNNIAGIRIGSTGSTVKDATVVVDEVPPHMGDSLNARGIRLRGKRDQLIENCRIVYGPDAGATTGALTLNGANGHATIRNVSIEMNSDSTRAILAKSPEITGNVSPTFDNVSITGTAAAGQTATINGRPGTTFRNCCIRQSGDGRDGIQFVESSNCEVEDSQINVPGEPIILDNSSLASAYVASSSCNSSNGS